MMAFSCSLHTSNTNQHVGRVISHSPLLDELLPSRCNSLEVLATGFKWTEGPLWVPGVEVSGYLVFSDTRRNKIYRWEEGSGPITIGVSRYVDRSGCRFDAEACKALIEPGSNGLTLQAKPGGEGEGGLLVLCEHGDRRVSRIETNGEKTSLATHHNGKRLNSPNDAIFSREGHLYFTDPSYGFVNLEDDTNREQDFNGIYMVRNKVLANLTHGSPGPVEAELLVSNMTRPNGLAFSPDGSLLYVLLLPLLPRPPTPSFRNICDFSENIDATFF
jgi:gluconolactonase